MEALVHAAYVLYLLSYLMRDILWLRVFTVIAAVCLVVYFYWQPEPLLTAISWNLAFVALNLYWIARLLLERRPVAMNEEQARLHQLAFNTMKPRDMLMLLNIGTWEEHTPGQSLIQRGDFVGQLSIISLGKADVEIDGRMVNELTAGQFIGTTGFVCEDPADVDVIVTDAIRCLAWPGAKLKHFLEKNPELRVAFQRTLNRDLIRQLRSTQVRPG